jgi:hypothetical protein
MTCVCWRVASARSANLGAEDEGSTIVQYHIDEVT